MKKQSNQVIALVVLLVIWAISWHYNKIPAPPPSVIVTNAAKAQAQDSVLKNRFRRVRSEMDALYHYRIKPVPFDPSGNPFRIPAGMVGAGERAAPVVSTSDLSKGGQAGTVQTAPVPAEFGEPLLKHAIQATRIGGVVTLNDISQIQIDGQLHKEGDLFTTKVLTKEGPYPDQAPLGNLGDLCAWMTRTPGSPKSGSTSSRGKHLTGPSGSRTLPFPLLQGGAAR